MVRHRWAPGLIGSRTASPRALIAYFEAILADVDRRRVQLSPRPPRRSTRSAAWPSASRQELFSPGGDGGPGEDAEAEIAAMADVFPHLTAMVAAELHDNAEDPLGWCDSQAEFEFTLDLILDGLARHQSGRFNASGTS